MSYGHRGHVNFKRSGNVNFMLWGAAKKHTLTKLHFIRNDLIFYYKISCDYSQGLSALNLNFVKCTRNVNIYCTISSGNMSMQSRWGGIFYSRSLHWSSLIVTVKIC